MKFPTVSACAALVLISVASLHAQDSVVLDGTSGSTTLTSNLSTDGGLSLSLGFFADYLIVGGGGGGGAGIGGGGGAGEFIEGSPMQLAATNHAVTVGTGGSGSASNEGNIKQGGNSSIFGFTANGGGAGGGIHNDHGGSGGSGGGGGFSEAGSKGGGGSVLAGDGFGNAGGSSSQGSGPSAVGAGGGGAGGAGANNNPGAQAGGNGGAGRSSDISGTSLFYAGGGGGGINGDPANQSAGSAGLGQAGGGNGGGPGSRDGNNAAANSGSGGGGAGNSGVGGDGGSGLVIVRYAGASLGNIGGTVSAGTGSAAGQTLHSFTTVGNSNFDLSGVDMNARLGAVENGVISGNGNLVFTGPGRLTLNATNTYTGTTTVAAGELVVDGSIAGSTVTVQDGAVVSGSGTLGGLIVASGGTIAPGNSPGTQTVDGNTVWEAGGNYNWEIYDADSTAGTGWDLLSISGTLDLSALAIGSEFNINLWTLSDLPQTSGEALNLNPEQTYTWTIATAAGGIIGYTGTEQFIINTDPFNSTDGYANPIADGWGFSILQSGNDLNLVYSSPSPEPIPEPGTWAAAALLAGGAAFLRWRKRKTS